MTQFNWLCVDDERTKAVDNYILALGESVKGLSILRFEPKEIGDLIKELEKAQPDGIILDFRLDEQPNQKGETVSFRGITLAQELRMRMSEGSFPDIPLVMWSVDKKLQSFNASNTAHDLFDQVYQKDVEIANNYKDVAHTMVSLSVGYRKLADSRKVFTDIMKHIWNSLGLTVDEGEKLDSRIFDDVALRSFLPNYELAYFIRHVLLERPGPLINEALLAARLGVSQNSPSWPTLKEIVGRSSSYTGVFAEAWPRWWMHRVEKWWRDEVSEQATLRRLNSSQRIELIAQKLKLSELRPIEPIEEHYGRKFWTICNVYNNPLDPMDGIKILTPDFKVWQDVGYMSCRGAINRFDWPPGVRPHPLESSRIRALMEKRNTDGEAGES